MTARARYARMGCSVPDCRRGTCRYAGGEWLCGKHWGRLTKAERRVFSRCKRQARKVGLWTDRGERVWRALVRRAAL